MGRRRFRRIDNRADRWLQGSWMSHWRRVLRSRVCRRRGFIWGRGGIHMCKSRRDHRTRWRASGSVVHVLWWCCSFVERALWCYGLGCSRHFRLHRSWSSLVLRGNGGTADLLWSRWHSRRSLWHFGPARDNLLLLRKAPRLWAHFGWDPKLLTCLRPPTPRRRHCSDSWRHLPGLLGSKRPTRRPRTLYRPLRLRPRRLWDSSNIFKHATYASIQIAHVC